MARYGATASETKQNESTGNEARVPVNEDFLFDVDINERELMPVYWVGPTYESKTHSRSTRTHTHGRDRLTNLNGIARRGTWFYQEGSNYRPCDENLAAQVEEVLFCRNYYGQEHQYR